MVPPDYLPFFMTLAAVGATLFGLIFVAISIAPESVVNADAPLERQIKATTAYVALLNPVVVSMFALVPHQEIGLVVITASSIGLINTLAMILSLVRSQEMRIERLRHSLFIVGGLVMYGYETYFAALLIHTPDNGFAIFGLADLLVMIALFGIIRAWQLIGVRQFHLQDILTSRKPKSKEEEKKEQKGPGVRVDISNHIDNPEG